GKLTDENVKVFNRIGIVVDKNATQAQVLALLHQKFGGQAKVYGDSNAGAIDKIKNKIEEWRRSLGGALGPAQTVLAVLPGMSAGFTLLGAVLGPASEAVKW